MCGQSLSERGKAKKEKLAFGRSKMALINCSGLLIGWEGETVGGTVCQKQIPRARAHNAHTHTQTKHTTHLPSCVSLEKGRAEQP